jgi:hypothetical protein
LNHYCQAAADSKWGYFSWSITPPPADHPSQPCGKLARFKYRSDNPDAGDAWFCAEHWDMLVKTKTKEYEEE